MIRQLKFLFKILLLFCTVFVFLTNNKLSAEEFEKNVLKASITKNNQLIFKAIEFSKYIDNIFLNKNIIVLGEVHFIKELKDLILLILRDSNVCHTLVIENSPLGALALNDYVNPEYHENAQRFFQEHPDWINYEGQLDIYSKILKINNARDMNRRIKIYALDGYMNTYEDVVAYTKYFVNNYAKFLQEDKKIKILYSEKPNVLKAALLFEYFKENKDNIFLKISSKDNRGHFSILLKAMEDSFMRDEINTLFGSDWEKGAKARENIINKNWMQLLKQLSINEKILCIYGSWHVSEDNNINFTYFLKNDNVSTRNKIFTINVIPEKVNLKNIEISRDYKTMYWVYANLIKLIHKYIDKYPNSQEGRYKDIFGEENYITDALSQKLLDLKFDGSIPLIFYSNDIKEVLGIKNKQLNFDNILILPKVNFEKMNGKN